MITFHPTAKRTLTGFVPMVTLRGERGRMVGSKTPQGAGREFRTFLTPGAALSEAVRIARHVADTLRHDGLDVRVAA